MSFYVDSKQLVGNAAMQQQFAEICQYRQYFHYGEQALAANFRLKNNAVVPIEIWSDFDRTIRGIVSEQIDPIFADLMPLARSVNIGNIVARYSRYVNNELEVRSSIDGQHAKPVNHTSLSYDGVVIPVHSTQVGRTWRETEGMRASGFDPLVQDQAVAAREVRRRTLENFIDGTDLSFEGFSAFGIKNSPNTMPMTLTVDLTSPTATYDDIRGVLVSIVSALTGRNGTAEGEITVYVSPEIFENMSRLRDSQISPTQTLLEVLMLVPGISAIKKSNRLVDNELLAMVVSAQYVQPVVAMPITTTPVPRTLPMDDFHVMVWGASGLQVTGGVLYAAGA